MIPPHRQNNFDLIRLLAAAQVVIAHAIGHTPLAGQLSGWGKQVFDAFMMLPGVPVFFVISGFLITKSFERDPANLAGFFWRRALRIFPALWVCLIVTLAALAATGFLDRDFILSKTFAAWLAGQITFLQFYNPEHFRGFGLGVANGALWTITVELQFYIFIPIFHFLTRGAGDRSSKTKIIIAVLFFASFAAFCLMDDKVNGPGGYTAAPVLYKLLFVTLIPNLWMFLLGILIHRNFAVLKPWIEGKFLPYFAAYAAFMALVAAFVPDRSPLFYLAYLPARTILAFATIAGAFTLRPLSRRLLRGNDISYGIYIYHSVVINVLLELGMLSSLVSVLAVYAISIALALLSWRLVEKPALACKSASPKLLWDRLRLRADRV
jgi:peptidoglycan/LPS O-acetylase OafA/YrhL